MARSDSPLNLVLIGMPGSGKTSLGKRLSKQLGMPLFDTDAMIEAQAQQSITDIFATLGEAVFRDMESACATEAASHAGIIIATGGGIILRPENMRHLARSGLVVFIDRSPEQILCTSTLDDRPLVHNQADRLWALYHERIALYRAYAQHHVSNAGPIRCSARAIATLYSAHTGSV